jgi:glycosyltransferase involved in cell wall biosynthesis
MYRQRKVFRRFVEYGWAELNAGRGETAAAYAQIAADYGWFNHPGLFASQRLERLLKILAYELERPASPVRPQERPTRVLHVLTAAYDIGGHTRLVWRWMASDHDRSHSVVLTSQREFRPDKYQAPPAELVDAADRGGGQLFELTDGSEGVLKRAQALRDIAVDFDVVVLHIHPWDAVPAIALHGVDRPTVIFMNHADHVFWIGVSVSDIVAHIREESGVVSQQFRGVEAARNYVLPLPLVARRGGFSSDEAKRQLAIPDDAVVLLSAGAPHKYKTTTGPHFVDMLLPILETHPNAVLLVVGPSDGTPWREANAKSGGRVRLYGLREDIDLFLAAADIFLNSFPLGSLTTALEAALHGIPIINYEIPGTTFVRSSDLAFADPSIHQTSPEGYVGEVGRMIVDEERRRTVGGATGDNVRRWHCGEGWRERLETLYERVRWVDPAPTTLDVDDDRDLAEADYSVHQFHAMTRYWEHFAEARLIRHARFMPNDRRLMLAARTRKLVKLIPPIDIRTRGHLERPRRYVAADPVYPAGWSDFSKGLVRLAGTQTGDLARGFARRYRRPLSRRGVASL